MLTNQQYGKRIRERQKFFSRVTRLIAGRDRRLHSMTIARKSGPGIGNFADVTKPMPAEKLTFVRKRAVHVTKEAIQRQWILSNPFAAIRKRVIVQ